MSHPRVKLRDMDDVDVRPPLFGTRSPRNVCIGTVVDSWQCPSCDRTFDVVYRPGRPRLYCSHACRQRAYRWRRQHAAHTVTAPGVCSAGAYIPVRGLIHALRTERDPMWRRRDRRGREVTVCGVLARGSQRSRSTRPPYVGYRPDASGTCRTCAALTVPRPLGLVPPGAWTPRPDPRAPLDPPDDIFLLLTARLGARYRPGPAPGRRCDSPGAPPEHQPGRR